MTSLALQLIGPMKLVRDGQPVDLPGSRKVRALLGYLAVAANPAQRSHLCDLLWDVADDPRGELRWCLSKLRGLIEDRRVVAEGDTIAVDLADCAVDAVSIATACQADFGALSPEELRATADLFAGDFCDGLTIERNPGFDSWLVSQRRRFRDMHMALLEHIAERLCVDEARPYLDRWIALAPFDLRPHELMLNALAAQGRLREGEAHLAATAKLFRAEGLDPRPIGDIWRQARGQAESVPATATVPANPLPAQAGTEDPAAAPQARRASIAVMPFRDMSATSMPGGPADALVHDIITRFAKLRSLRVIAQGTMFALKENQHSRDEIAQMLDATYVVNGSFWHMRDRISVRVELADMRNSSVVWAEVFEQKAADIFVLLEEIGLRIVLAVEREIETLESSRAILKPPGSLDAWEAHHRGLWHVYRFTRADNAQAQQFFRSAVALDPTFSRAHAGLSFTHWQNAFQGWADRDGEAELAYRAASDSLMHDDRDPTAHWAMGRAVWLKGMHDQSVDELEQAAALSPNFALAYYCLSFIQAQTGDPAAAVAAADKSRDLSPFDPLLFAMLASRALGLIRLGRYEDAADWAIKAARRPNAHVQIFAIAAFALVLADRVGEALVQVEAIRQRQPAYGIDNFFSAFRILPEIEPLYRNGARLIGLA